MTQSRRLSRVDRRAESTGLMFLVFFSNLLHLAASTVLARQSHDYERLGVTKVRSWLARHPRYHAHSTPISGGWLNLVERLFAEVTER